MMFGFMASDVLVGALSVELFPTSYRATASGLRSIAAMAGAVSGLWLEGALYGLAGSHSQAIAWMLPVTLLSVVVVVAFLPETASRALEEIAPDAPAPGSPEPAPLEAGLRTGDHS